MNKLTDWIKRHQIVAFFLLGIVLCFGTLYPAVLIIPQEDRRGKVESHPA